LYNKKIKLIAFCFIVTPVADLISKHFIHCEVNSNGMFRPATTPTLKIYLPEKEKASEETEDFLHESIKKNLAMVK